LGEPSDRKITMWQEMFLPRRLHDVVGSLQIRDSTGAMRPLVRGERVLFKATRPPEAESPPNLAPWLTLIGFVLAAIFAWLGIRAASGSRGARVAAAIAMSVWCVVAGLLGVLLTLLWTVTDHVFAHRNENLLLFNPLWLVLAVLIAITMWSGRAAHSTRVLALGLAGLSAVGLLAHLVTVSSQVNLAVIGLALPPALAIAWAAAKQLESSAAGVTARATPVAVPPRATLRSTR
jgi:cytochrome bd-type quinol oxidase subunit 2